jgi:GNAT-family acetyltransferase (TIGR03103 family)
MTLDTPRQIRLVPARYDELNRYTQIIVDEALRRDIDVEVRDPARGELALTCDGHTVTTLESLSELTSAVAFRRCDDKRYTRLVLERAGIAVPRGRSATFDQRDELFLHECDELVVKPARGEQGWGVSVGIRDAAQLQRAISSAAAVFPDVLLEERCAGDDLRVVVIGDEVVAAAVRRPPAVVGTGLHTVAELIELGSRQRADAIGGSARVPIDPMTLDAVRAGGYDLDDVVPRDAELTIRFNANVHSGGTIHDVTDELHPALADVAIRAARAIDIPVVGLDLLVESVTGPEYVMIEANEQPGLANHEPRPTAQRFVDLLFPQTAR